MSGIDWDNIISVATRYRLGGPWFKFCICDIHHPGLMSRWSRAILHMPHLMMLNHRIPSYLGPGP